MNFWSSGGSSKGTTPFSHSSSSSSSSSQKIPFSYQQRSWLSNNDGELGADLVVMDSSPTTDDRHTSSELDLGINYTAAGVTGPSSTSTTTMMQIEREHMFDKVVTPSDVGKLNRLVIPKQHAEKYFPLDSSTNEKGLLLNFEDRNGKPWRFRYSYWNSSQSYVMTKGWSRFVKEKKLDAGDIVSFQRGVGELGKDRLFIDWRRRPDAPVDMSHFTHMPFSNHFHRSIHHQYHPPTAAWNHPLFLQPDHSHLHSRMSSQHHQQQYSNYPPHHSSYSYGNIIGSSTPNYYDMMSSNTTVVNGNPCPSGSVVYLRSGAQIPQVRGGSSGHSHVTPGRLMEPMVYDSVPVVQGKAAAKRLRLFGVNMDCPISDSDESSCEIMLPPYRPASAAASTTYSHAPAQFLSSSSTLSTIPSLQFRSTNASNEEPSKKGKGSMSLDLDI